MNMKLLGLLLGGTMAVLWVGCKREQSGAGSMPERPPAAVQVAVATTSDVPIYIDQIGTTTARESVIIQPQVGGKVTQAHFTDGADVKKGDLLFTIDPRPFKALLAQEEATLAENRAKLKYARDEIRRMEEIRSSGAVSIQEWEQKVSAVDVAVAQVASAEANVETAKLNMEYCEIRSPLDGRAGQRMVDPGNVVSAGGPEGGSKLLTIQAFDPIYADFTVTENELGTVRKFMSEGRLPQADPQGKLKVLVDVPGDAKQVIDALGGFRASTQPVQPAPSASATRPESALSVAVGATTRPAPGPREGVLTFLDNAVQQNTGTVRVRATLPNTDKYFWPGQFVRVRLVLATKPNAVLVPAQAQQIGQQGPYVYVVEQGTVKDAMGKETSATVASLRPIVPGQRQGGMLVVEQGVEAGEQVVTQGHMMVAPGAAVTVLPPQGGAPGAPAGAAGATAVTGGEGSEKKS